MTLAKTLPSLPDGGEKRYPDTETICKLLNLHLLGPQYCLEIALPLCYNSAIYRHSKSK
jgi:hypothetical protein